MIRRTPRSNRTGPPFPDPPLFRSRRDISLCSAHHLGKALGRRRGVADDGVGLRVGRRALGVGAGGGKPRGDAVEARSEEHTSELQSLMRISYAVFCLKKKKQIKKNH